LDTPVLASSTALEQVNDSSKMNLSSFLLAVVLFSGYAQEIAGSSTPTSNKKAVTLEACRRNPTWRGETVDNDECRLLTGWTPRDFWWRFDKNKTHEMLHGKEEEIAECIDDQFQKAKDDGLWWAQYVKFLRLSVACTLCLPNSFFCDSHFHRCNEMDTDNDDNCRVPATKVVGYYEHYEGDDQSLYNGACVIAETVEEVRAKQ
jgi:hypothetical protein